MNENIVYRIYWTNNHKIREDKEINSLEEFETFVRNANYNQFKDIELVKEKTTLEIIPILKFEGKW